MKNSIFFGISAGLLVILGLHQARAFTIESLIKPDRSSFPVITAKDTRLEAMQDPQPYNLQKEFNSIFETRKGTYSAIIKDFKTGEKLVFNRNTSYYGASLYKVPIAVATIRQIEEKNFYWDTTFPFYNKYLTEGSGKFDLVHNRQYSIDNYVQKLLKDSDNSVQSLLQDVLPQDSLKTAFETTAATIEDGQLFYNKNTLTVETALAPYEKLYTSSKYITGSSKAIVEPYNARKLLDIMTHTSFDNRIHAGLRTIDKELFAHKIGSWGNEGSWHDCGVLIHLQVGVCLLSKNTTVEEFSAVARQVGTFIYSFTGVPTENL